MKITAFLIALFLSNAGYGQAPAFPLQYSNNKRFLEDQHNRPFLINAATGWQIYTKLTTEEAREYLGIRKAQGFNSILTQLCMHEDDVNRYGQAPFFNNNDFSKPNDKYFDHVFLINKIADSLGLYIIMSQPWQGCCLEGWGIAPDKPLQRNGPAKCYSLGKYFGLKFHPLPNIMWIKGGDQDPIGDRQSIEAMAKGIFETAGKHFITYHAKPTHSSTDLYQYAPWLGVSMIYTYWRDKPNEWVRNYLQMIEVYEMAIREYMKTDTMLFFWGEALYEGFEGNDMGTPQVVRRQPYWAILCGGMGAAYGDDTWYFPEDWKQKITTYPAASQMKHFYNFFNTISWWNFIPDYAHRVLINGYGEYGKTNYVTAAMSTDSSFFVAYLTGKQQVTIDMTKLKTKRVKAQWYDPRTGLYLLIGHYRNMESFSFIPPAEEDWLLFLQAE